MITRAPVVPLELLEQDEQARIVEIDGPADAVHRLHEMGLLPGVVIRLLRPGRPCILAVGDSRISLRPADDSTVLVEPLRVQTGA